jgi:signal transduction histidine kinase
MQEGLAGPINDEQRRTLEQVKGASDELLTLIGDLLELTALKRGAVDAIVADMDPRDPLRDAVATAKRRRDEVTLEVEEPEIAPTIRSDRRTIAKSLGALLDNAFKFTHEGKVRVWLEVVGDRVVYCVQDTGIGIPADAQTLIFDEFRQVDGTMTREYGGPGLGLSLARRLARLLQGDITLTSDSGAGSTFRLEIPLRFEAKELV